jgi:hypothetical protein
MPRSRRRSGTAAPSLSRSFSSPFVTDGAFTHSPCFQQQAPPPASLCGVALAQTWARPRPGARARHTRDSPPPQPHHQRAGACFPPQASLRAAARIARCTGAHTSVVAAPGPSCQPRPLPPLPTPNLSRHPGTPAHTSNNNGRRAHRPPLQPNPLPRTYVPRALIPTLPMPFAQSSRLCLVGSALALPSVHPP